jgi:3-mercaptopyruvate sulfurtransferase SseA
VVTVAELEVLDFINRLKEKKARLLIDIRENNFYKEGTIPGAINLPSSMLKDESKYQIEVLKLLGAKRNNTKSNLKWSFTNALSLLIFGSSATSDDASSSVKKLLELGYPSSKLLYYRTGFQSWKALGLTII